MEYAGGLDNYLFIMKKMANDVPLPEAIYGKYSILGQESYREKLVRQIIESGCSLKGIKSLSP